MSAKIENATSVIWKRRDLPGHETCRIIAGETDWRLTGVAILLWEARACRLDYLIDCDAQWVTRSAVVSGWVGEQTIDVRVTRDAGGRWTLNGEVCEGVAGCLDVDLNFSP